MNLIEFRDAVEADRRAEAAASRPAPERNVWDEIGDEIERYPLGRPPRARFPAESRHQAAAPAGERDDG